jgi:hypothetical protein
MLFVSGCYVRGATGERLEGALLRFVMFGDYRAVTIEKKRMELKTIQDIERAIDALPPQELARLYAWLDRHRPQQSDTASKETVFDRGLGLFGSPSDSALLEEVVRIAYDERRRPTQPPNSR